MRQLSLDHLQTLVAIADLGTFSAAAQALHLAQPTVSLHISELEARMNTSLLVRGGRRVTPSAAGELLIEHARRLLRAADEALTAMKLHVEGAVGRVRLGASSGVSIHLLPQVLETMKHSHPELSVEVCILGSSEIIERINQGSLDVGLVSLPQKLPGELVMTPWRSDPFMAFIPAGRPTPEVATPQWLADEPLIFSDPSTHMYQMTVAWFAAAGLSPRGRIELLYTETMKDFVAAGYGAAILPMEDKERIQVAKKVTVLPLAPPLTRHIGIIHHRLSALDHCTDIFLQTLALFRQIQTADGVPAHRRKPKKHP